jgi:hypothetical protein
VEEKNTFIFIGNGNTKVNICLIALYLLLRAVTALSQLQE